MVATRRHATQGKSDKYEIGDRVEVLRVDGLEVGILLSKQEYDEEEGRSEGVIHWIVSVDGSSQEEIVSEKALGRILDDTEQSDSSTFEKVPKGQLPVKKSSSTKVKFMPSKKKVERDYVSTRSGEKTGEMVVASGTGVKPKKNSDNQEQQPQHVVAVKMHTGTLFIYRGENRRVEFIRTV